MMTLAAIKFWIPREERWVRYEVELEPLRVHLQGRTVDENFFERLPTALHEGGPVRFTEAPRAWLESMAQNPLSHMAVEL